MADGRRYELSEAQVRLLGREIASEVCRPGNGIAGSPLPKCMATGRGIQVFTQWDEDGTNFLPAPTYQTRRLVQFEPPEPMWLHASCFGFEVERVSDDSTPQPQLSPSEIKEDGSQYSLLRWRLAWGGAGGGQIRDMDVGPGVVVSVYACSAVTIDALIPVGAVVSAPNSEPRATFTGRKLDTLLGAEIVPSNNDGPEGPYRGRLTTVHVGTGAVQFIPVPPGARRVLISSTTNPLTFLWSLGAANTDGTVPSVGTVVIGTSRVEEVLVPGLARFLALPATLQRCVLVWSLDL